MTSIAIFCLIMVTWKVGDAAFGPKKLYSMDLPVEAVSVKVIGRELVIVGPWYIGGVSNVHWKFRQSSRMKPRIINKDIANPRSVGRIPGNAFRGSKALTYWVASWGTNDTSGAMYVLRPTTTYSVWKDISIDSGWNYERSQWIDMNRDGRIDCLTARFRGGVGQLLWFNQPAGQSLWGQQIIHEGMADGNFIGFVKGRKTYILVAGLQFSTLGLYWSMSRANLWSASRMVRHRVIDNYGKFYDVQYIDLNKDGRPDVLTTTVNVGNSRGHVLGYEVPDDLQNKIWNRRVLAAGFQGDYSPGKATAFWPNKWKRKTDRPSVFLSGAGQEVLFILSPRPARTGWAYVRSAVKAGTGMIGLPYIGDIDGDSYPEVFVPQGKKLHVFSYDYNAAVAEAPASRAPPGAKVTPRPVVKYVPPFFRPTAATLPPLIPRGPPAGGSASDDEDSALAAGGLSGDAAARFGASGVLPSSGGSRPVPPLAGLPPLTLRGGQSPTGGGGARSGGSSPNLPATVPRFTPAGGGGAGAAPPRGSGGAFGLGNSPVSGGAAGVGNGGVSLLPVMTNVGPAYVPVRNTNNAAGGQGNSQQAQPPANSPQQFSWEPGSSSNNGGSQGQSPDTSENIVPYGGSRIHAQTPDHQGGGAGGVGGGGGASSSEEIVPYGGGSESGYANNQRITSDTQNIVPLGAADAANYNPLVPVFEEYTPQPDYYDQYYSEYEENAVEPPPNAILSITSESYAYREEADDACSFQNKVLCTLQMLEASTKAGSIPLVEWGWFSMEGRAAQIQDCIPGDVKWPGFKCHNGIVGHLPIKQSAHLKGFCCAVLRGANVTDRKFSNFHDAEEGCKQLNTHICSLDEMYKVWDKSSYKSDVWGWYQDDIKLIKMVHSCNMKETLWPGYECLSRKLATSKIVSHVQESAYCCQNSSALIFKLSYIVLFFMLFISLSFI